MIDMEKVIKELEEISDYFYSIYHDSEDKEEYSKARDRWDAVEDTLALLKDHEAKTPVECEHNGYWHYTCPTCGNHEELFREWNYCPFCGQAVKWE